VSAAQALEEHVADGEAHRRDQREEESGQRELAADREADQRQPGECHRGASHWRAVGRSPSAKRGEHDGEERLRLHDHRGQPGRHAVRDAEELEDELARERA